jgi:hypothetical protein
MVKRGSDIPRPESTDRVPVLHEPGPPEDDVSTDSFPALAVPAATVELASSLRDAEQRLRELEDELEAARRHGQSLEAQLFTVRAQCRSLLQQLDARGADPGEDSVGVARILINEEGGSEVVHSIGRCTTVGRTPDNDIQVDSPAVSRHHAVLLSTPDHCIVEDLNSTNGVLVNGRRVGRQVLHDGDSVTIGNTVFRYQQRP